MFWEQIMKYWESPKYKAFCEWNKRNKNERRGRGERKAGKDTCGSISFTEHQLKRLRTDTKKKIRSFLGFLIRVKSTLLFKADRKERGRQGLRYDVSKIQNFQVHGWMCDRSDRWGLVDASGFNREVLQEQILGGAPQVEEAATTCASMSDDLRLIANVSGGLNCGLLYGAGSKAAHVRVESSRTAARLPPCYLEAEQRIMRWVEAADSSVCATFDEYVRQFAEQSHLPYTPMPPMIDIV
ncbi:hypothetical protein M9H77_21283 [Catharanthus roseus]|uniref:Uncharacterized protein n=1 Tax=Catharanthus roseus TaxID=4058 RepID=A0ACC0AM57_CATRO|nr:hypothetical protein M9H77_21283 [Catharanthus roseus]